MTKTPDNWRTSYRLKVMVIVGAGATEYVCERRQLFALKSHLKDSDFSKKYWLASYKEYAF